MQAEVTGAVETLPSHLPRRQANGQSVRSVRADGRLASKGDYRVRPEHVTLPAAEAG